MVLPAEFGSWRGAYGRLWNWAIDDTWDRVFTALPAPGMTGQPLGRATRGRC